MTKQELSELTEYLRGQSRLWLRGEAGEKLERLCAYAEKLQAKVDEERILEEKLFNGYADK